MLITEIIQHTGKHGGGTFEKGDLKTFEDGFIVGGVGESAIIPITSKSLLMFVLVHFIQKYPLIGTWFNDGHIHIDVVQWVENEGEALALGKELNQIAIWDCANNKEVTVS